MNINNAVGLLISVLVVILIVVVIIWAIGKFV